MNRISVLPEALANQIAAGEVVERPAAVVKELLENSLDAGARRIRIEVRGGGKSLIRVSDDGTGMSADDALLCLERHATSKVRTLADLQKISSFGFRGEAIPSIASVCRFKLTTRNAEREEGSEIIINGGVLHQVGQCGCPVGTTVEVRSLFYNMPARRKFLRTENTEMAHIQQTVLLQALAHPEVAFTYLQEDRPFYQLAPAPGLLERIRELSGADFCRNLLEVRHASHGVVLRGYIGRPGISRSNRTEQNVFVNLRPVDNRTVNYALMEGYHNSLMKGRYPVAILFLEMDPALVDVNVHPSKREVKFRDDAAVRAAVADAVRGALRETAQTLRVPLSGGAGPSGSPPAPLFQTPLPGPFPGTEPAIEAVAAGASPPNIPGPTAGTSPASLEEGLRFEGREIRTDQVFTGSAPFARDPVELQFHDTRMRLLGVLNRLYILAECVDGLILIDQHAAHERVMFEKLLARLESEPARTQGLLIPETVELPPRDFAMLQENAEVLGALGIQFSEFGRNTVLVDGLPPWLSKRKPSLVLRDLIDSLREQGGQMARERRFKEEQVVRAACRASVKANDGLTPAEAETLLRQLVECRQPYTCPHGRPTMILLTHAELEKKFGRIV
ncbi:MAG: DNA mismatch repair endonuclease MutL [Verrucomicrobiae bacterium]|nr:DNA mismatch repair endonuclease MutL [Verrucomicrobiae bacterium]